MNSENITDSPKKQARYDRAYLRMATEWAKLSHCKRKQVGAIIVKDKIIIADGFNESTFTDSEGETWYADEYGDRSYMWDYM